VFRQIDGAWYVSCDAIQKILPSASNITRVRVVIQNEKGELLPTLYTILKKRGLAKKDRQPLNEWKEDFIN
jgi:hypothetical protein